MYTSNIHPLPREKFEILAKKHGKRCVTIYLPMHKKGKEQNEHLAQANLKKCLTNVRKLLTTYQICDEEIVNYLKPIEKLIANIELWRNPSKGLPIFLDQKGLSYYTLPISFKTKIYVASNFYVTPLIPLYYNTTIYYLLELSQDYVKFYEASKYGLTDLNIKSFAPNKLEKAVGFDFRQKMLQFRTGHNIFSSGAFHGHGEGKDDEKKELFTFFRAIDKGIKQALKNKSAPLVVACVNRLFDTYKQVNTYTNLYIKNISGDPEFKNKSILHKESWELIQNYFEKTKKAKLNQFTEMYNTPKVSYQINEIIPAAVDGKIDTLFVSKNTDLFGVYNTENRHLILNDKKEIQNGSLINLASVNTVFKGGEVYLLDAEDMPEHGKILNALFKY